MSNLTNSNKTTGEGSLVARAREALNQGKGAGLAAPKPAPALAPAAAAPTPITKQQQCLLIDCSASMAEDVEPGRSKHDALRRLLPQFLGTRRFAFSDGCASVLNLPMPRGGTDMAGAFAHIKRAGIRQAVLITDGLPDSEEEALVEARGLRLDIFYVGPHPRPAFLDKLAAATNGTVHTGNLKTKHVQQITTTVKQVLAITALREAGASAARSCGPSGDDNDDNR